MFLIILLAERLAELLERFLLLAVQVARRLDIHGDVLVAAAAAVEAGNALAFQAERRAALCPLGDGVLHLAVDRRDLKLRAEHRLRERDGRFAQDARALAAEDLVRTHGHNDQQIARGAAVLTRVALRAQRNGLPVVDARRNADLDGLAVADHALAAALGAGLVDDLTLASAALAGGRRRHIAQRRLAALLDHAAAATVRADLGGRALGAARAAAVRTLLDAR